MLEVWCLRLGYAHSFLDCAPTLFSHTAALTFPNNDSGTHHTCNEWTWVILFLDLEVASKFHRFFPHCSSFCPHHSKFHIPRSWIVCFCIAKVDHYLSVDVVFVDFFPFFFVSTKWNFPIQSIHPIKSVVFTPLHECWIEVGAFSLLVWITKLFHVWIHS